METHRLLLNEAGTPIVYVRTPLLPYDVGLGLYAGDWQANLKKLLASHHELRVAIRVASPALARELAKWLAGEEVSARALRRLLAYALRASTRSTPFGLFAAISRVAIGERTTLEVEPEMHTRTRVDMGWLAELIAQWREEPEFRKKIRVTVNDAMLRRGDRYTAYHPLRTGRGQKGLTYTPMTFTATEAVHFLEGKAQSPVSMQELSVLLHEQYDETSEECFRLLEDLWQAGFFVDELGIDPATPDPPREVLARVEARESGRTADAVAVLDALATLDERSVSSRTNDDYDAIDAMQLAILPAAESASQTDAIRSTTGTLSIDVLDDVRLLAKLMLRGAALELQEYRKHFVERYEGVTREVPLLELVHPSFGLGPPASPSRDPLPQELLERQTLVACEALRDGRPEVHLDESLLDSLMPRLEDSRLATSFDIGFEVLTSSYEALQRGDYLITSGAFTYAARAGGALGRFADALGEQAQSDLRAIAGQLEALDRDAIIAELVASPSWSRGLNVSIRPVMHSHRVRVGLMNDRSLETVIPLDDLVVGLDETGFYLRSVRLRKRIIPTESHALNTAETTPTISRFLSMLAYDGKAFPREYEWHCRLPFYPRVRCGRVILRRATWRFAREAIEKATSGSFNAFAERWGMPQYMELVSDDNRLLIDTTSDICGQMVRDHLRPDRETITLEEVLCTPEKAWVQDSAGARFRAEFIASFVRTSPVERKSPTATIVAREERSSAPGSEWLYIKVYGDAHDQDRLVDSRIAPLLQRLSEAGALEHWYFVRYADPRDHLRIRMKIANGSRSHVITSVLDLLADLTQDGTVDASGIATYDREVERYGGPEGMAACEVVFAADSAHVLQYVVSVQMSNLDERVAFAARSIVEMALECADAAQTFNPRSFTSERATLGDVDRQNAREIKRQIRDARIIGPELRSALRELAALETGSRLSRPLESIFDSVVHMHANRCGLSEKLERRARVLARDVLQSVRHLRAQAAATEAALLDQK